MWKGRRQEARDQEPGEEQSLKNGVEILPGPSCLRWDTPEGAAEASLCLPFDLIRHVWWGTVNWSDLLRHISYGPRFKSPSCLWFREKSASLESVYTKTPLEEPTTAFIVRLLECSLPAYWMGHFMFYFLCEAFCCTVSEEGLMGGVSWICDFCHVLSHLSLLWIGNFSVQTVWNCSPWWFHPWITYIFCDNPFFMHDSTSTPLVVQLTTISFILCVLIYIGLFIK